MDEALLLPIPSLTDRERDKTRERKRHALAFSSSSGAFQGLKKRGTLVMGDDMLIDKYLLSQLLLSQSIQENKEDSSNTTVLKNDCRSIESHIVQFSSNVFVTKT